MAESPSAPATREVIILNLAGALSNQISQLLRDRKFYLRVIQNFDELVEASKNLFQPILVCETGSDEEEAQRCIDELTRRAPQITMPVILVGANADRFERQLDTLFPASTTLNTPYTPAELLAAVSYICRTHLERIKQSPSGKIIAPLFEKDGVAPQPASTPTPEKAALSTDVPTIIFENLGSLNLFGRQLGGQTFCSPELSLDLLSKEGFLPSAPEPLAAVESLCQESGKWAQLQMARTSYMAQKIIESLNPDPALRENVKISGFLYAWSFAASNPLLLQRPYLDEESASFRVELCSRIKDSAMTILSNLKLEEAGKVVATMARVVGREQRPSDDDLSVTASALMAADLSSRICYFGGPWNPRKAHALLASIKKSPPLEIHPTVLTCMVKIIAEALSSRTPIISLRKDLRFNKEFLAFIRAEQKKPVAASEQRVKLASLTPGMRLSQPLRSLDGREILSPDLTLDEDLIWRLWQLAAIRPLYHPVVHKSEEQALKT